MSRIITRALPLLLCSLLTLSLTAAGPQPSPRAAAVQRPGSAAAPLPFQIRSAAAALPPQDTAQRPAGGQRAAAEPAAMLVSNAAHGALPLPEAAPAPIPGQGPWMRGTLVAQTERLDLYVGKKTFGAEQVAALAPRLERYLRASEARFGTTLGRRVSLAFYRPAMAPDRGTRGVAYTEEGRAEVFYRPSESIERAAVVAAHELAHHLQAERYGAEAQQRADMILLEGMATWITGEPWLARYGAGSWKERARQIGAAGVPLRLLKATRYGSDNAYELWASFVDFLVERYGFEKVDALYRSSHSRKPGSADYAGVLGAPLDALADEWRAWVEN